MVFLLGRMGDNKRALNLIIERLGDVQRVRIDLTVTRAPCAYAEHSFRGSQAIQFAQEQNDHDLWEDLLRYSETRPSELGNAGDGDAIHTELCCSFEITGFIRALLENVGAEIDPIRLIRKIKNGLEIPGLKPALIKILQDFNLQVSWCSLPSPFLSYGCSQRRGNRSPDLIDGRLQEYPLQRLSTSRSTTASRSSFGIPLDG